MENFYHIFSDPGKIIGISRIYA